MLKDIKYICVHIISTTVCPGAYKNTHICVSYSLEYLKYLNKYALTTNISECVIHLRKTFAFNAYLLKYFIAIFKTMTLRFETAQASHHIV